MRSKKTLFNIIASFLLQIVNIISGFIIPWLIIRAYGSGTNGVITSITQFLGVISLLEGGVGGVLRASLYGPLAARDTLAISRILKAAEKFFRHIAYMFVVYLFLLAIAFPYISGSEFSSFFIFTLVIILGLKIVSQYFFGLHNQVLLQADQKSYLVSFLQIITVIISTTIATILINLGANIHIVQFASASIFFLKPIILNYYVKKRYGIIRGCVEDKQSLQKKWDGLGHHLSYFLHNKSDIIVITLFTNILEVSVYSIYIMITIGIRSITTTFSTGIEAVFGDMMARKETKKLVNNFRLFEFLFFMLITILFTSASQLILPFVSLYTKGVEDAEYLRPLLAYLLLVSEAIFCIRFPYHSVVIAAGHFKETRNGAFLEAGINIALSLVLVNYIGIVGVVIGTLCAVTFRTIQYAVYLRENIINIRLYDFFKRIIVNVIPIIISIVAINQFPNQPILSYNRWLIYALEITGITTLTTVAINTLFYYKDMVRLMKILKMTFSLKTN